MKRKAIVEMHSMLREFYNYIANNTVGFFQGKGEEIRPGERYCLRLDNEDMVRGVDEALRNRTNVDGIQGHYKYRDVYETFTIRLSDSVEVVVASKTNGMTDDFLATLRNAELTDKRFPILMITHSPIDTITSGTGDLSANGMPFHAASIIAKVKEEIKNAQLSPADRILLEYELERKQGDRFSDKSSLYEYSDLLTVLGRGYVQKKDYAAFSLLHDPDSSHWEDEKKLRERLKENHQLFEHIDRVFRHGNIVDTLEKEYESSFITHLTSCKKKGINWYEDYTFENVKKSHEKNKKKQDNPLYIDEGNIEIYCQSPLEYSFVMDETAFIRSDGESKSKQRKKNILIYNPDQKEEITIALRSNISLRASAASSVGANVSVSSKDILIKMKATGCSFSRTEIKDVNNSITYSIKVCVVNILPEYLEEIQTNFYLDVAKSSVKKANLQTVGITERLIINPRKEIEVVETVTSGNEYICNYNQTLKLEIKEENIDIDTGKLPFKLKIGIIEIPLVIKDESIKPVELTGIRAFKLKHTERKSLEYRDGKIVYGTKEFFAKDPFKKYLDWEHKFIQNGWVAAKQTVKGLEELKINVPANVYDAYQSYLAVFKRSVPSLAYFSDDIKEAALKYINAVKQVLDNIPEGKTLSYDQSNILFLGTIVQDYDEQIISMSPLHPLNVLYQLTLLDEDAVGEVRDDLVEKLSPLYLLPYIKNEDRVLYHAVEQKHSPEWRIYAQQSNKRYHGARSYVQKLVCDKINQYKEHFSFLFGDIGNDQFCINLINMGDCREVLQGLIRYYVRELSKEVVPEDLTSFIVNIYSESEEYNEFSVLSNQRKLREYISTYGKDVEDISEMATILSSKIRCYYRNSNESAYQYAHLSFYEMTPSENNGVSRMDTITTGVSLGGVTSGTPSVLNESWYKTGFGTKYATDNELIKMAKQYNALFRVAFSGSSYEPNSCVFTVIENGTEGQLGKIYDSSNWVVFVDPKVDLSFFQKSKKDDKELMIIHYSDQYTSASGYDDITVTQKSGQYEEIIQSQLKKKGVSANKDNIDEIISLFNAINGGWMLRLLSAKKLAGAADSNFSREKMSILSAIKLCMAYYAHSDIVWIPISLEEMLRVSGGAGYSQKEGLLSAKNLGFEKGVTSDDILMIGIEGPVDNLKIYMHPVEVKIGLNPNAVITKAQEQVINTYAGLWKALWPEKGRNSLECKLSRNFLMQLVIVCCEKMKLYDVYPNEDWDLVTDKYREALLNEKYTFSNLMDEYIGKGTVVSFKSDVLVKSGEIKENVCMLEFPESMGSAYMVRTASEIEVDLDLDRKDLPKRLKYLYNPESPDITVSEDTIINVNESTEDVVEDVVISADIESVLEETDDQVEIETEESLEQKKVGIDVLFGTDVTDGQPLYWKPNDTNQVFHTNTGIIGTMGTGKTQFTKSVITQLYRNQEYNFGGQPLGILIFDYKGDYNESKEDFVKATNATILKPYHLPFNPLSLTKSKVFKPLLPIHTANAFKDTLSKVYNLGPKQQNTLFSCITTAYNRRGIMPGDPSTWDNTPPTFDMVYNIYANDEEIKKTDSLAAAMDKLYQFQVFEGDPAKTVSLFDLLQGVVVIDLSGYDSDIQSLIVAITLDLFYSQMQAAGSSKMDQQYRQLTKLILVDEADNFMSEGFPALKKILKEGREFGVGTILSTQFLKHFGSGEDDYSKYILTWVVHNVADLKSSDVEFVFKVEPKSTESQTLFNDIKSLKKHHSIIKISNFQPKYVEDRAFWELYRDLKVD